MTFNSIDFLLFFAVVLALYWTAQPRLRNAVLLISSYVFYGWWDWRFLSLLAISTVVDFTIGQRMGRSDDERVRKRLLLTSVAVNLGILGTFKYLNFFADSATALLDQIGWEADPFTLNVVLPVGISFYTFQTMSYTFDIYRRDLEPTSDFISFGTYVAYFPQLVAGPIERAQRLMPQILNTDRQIPTGRDFDSAIRLIAVGLAKKVVLADGIAHVANNAFDNSDDASGLMLVAGVIAFAIQIYGDFSGYTDIARGVSRLLGIELMVNFSQPYLSRNITEFWRRWHISLSNWLRDYLYIPLGGNRKGVAKTYRNLILTMLLGGLWHGASWNFVIWGALHGLYLVVHKLSRGGRVAKTEPRFGELGSILLTNAAVLFAWIFFRAETFSDAADVVTGIITFRGGTNNSSMLAMVAIFSIATLALDLVERRQAVRSKPSDTPTSTDPPNPILQGLSLGLAIGFIVLFSGGTPTPFIYFQF